jgi:hypothetical protein
MGENHKHIYHIFLHPKLFSFRRHFLFLLVVGLTTRKSGHIILNVATINASYFDDFLEFLESRDQ